MSWPFLKLIRRASTNRDRWGTLYAIGKDGSWSQFSYTYELPWRPNAKGKSRPYKSRIEPGTYEMMVKSHGPKGWRLELLNTGHRRKIQIHRAHESMYIEGCILPVSFLGFPFEKQNEPKDITAFFSILKMVNLRLMYQDLSPGKDGNPTIQIQ